MDTSVSLTLKKLRKLYAYEMAQLTANGKYCFGTEVEELETLALFHLDNQIGKAVNEFVAMVGDKEDTLPLIAALFQGVQTGLTSHLKNTDPEYLKFVETFAQEWAAKLEKERKK